jgi:hypothetical protein
MHNVGAGALKHGKVQRCQIKKKRMKKSAEGQIHSLSRLFFSQKSNFVHKRKNFCLNHLYLIRNF